MAPVRMARGGGADLAVAGRVDTHAVARAVRRALRLGAAGRPPARVAHALAGGVVALAVARAAGGAGLQLAGGAGEALVARALAERRARAAPAAVRRAARLLARLAGELGAAAARAVDALAAVRAVERADAEQAVGPGEPRVAHARAVALSM